MKCRWLCTVVSAVVLAGLFLGACSSGPTEEPLDLSPTVQVKEGGGLAVVDAMGRSVEFSELPQRVVVAGKSSLTIVNTLFLFPEAQDRVVGLVVGNQNPGDFLGFVDPTFDQKVVLEVEAGPEQIAPLEPDVVILRSFMADKLGKPLEQLDIPVVYVDLETPEQYSRDLGTLGQVLGNERRAEEIKAYYQEKLDQVDKNLEGLTGEQMPGVLLLQYNDKGGRLPSTCPRPPGSRRSRPSWPGASPFGRTRPRVVAGRW